MCLFILLLKEDVSPQIGHINVGLLAPGFSSFVSRNDERRTGHLFANVTGSDSLSFFVFYRFTFVPHEVIFSRIRSLTNSADEPTFVR